MFSNGFTALSRWWSVGTLLICLHVVSGQDSTFYSKYDPDNSYDYQPSSNNIIRDPSFFIVASKVVRPGHVYMVIGTLLQEQDHPVQLKASILKSSTEVGSANQKFIVGETVKLLIALPALMEPGDYKLRVEGAYDSSSGASIFVNETALQFSQKSMSIFIQTDKPVYKQGQVVKFRAIPITTRLKSFGDSVDIFMLDPNRRKLKRWLSQTSNVGTVSLEYELSDQPVYGVWTIQVLALNQVEELPFLVEEYYQTRFEVNVTMPAFFFTSDKYIYGTVMANYTSGAPVRGNLTLKVTMRSLNREQYDDRKGYGTDEPIEKYLEIEEIYPSWLNFDSYWSPYRIPHLKYFTGVYNFRYPITQLERFVPSLDNMELTVTASVNDKLFNENITAFTTSRVYNSSVKVDFLGGSTQVFKPSLPNKIYIAVSYHDGSSLSQERLTDSEMELSGTISMRSQGGRSIQTRNLVKSNDRGVWEMRLDLRQELRLEDNMNKDILSSVESMTLSATFKDNEGERAYGSLVLMAHQSPTNQQLKVETSSIEAEVGTYLMLHVHSNFYVKKFEYIVISKGIILLADSRPMETSLESFFISLSTEMAPSVTILVYTITNKGIVVADSLTVPVNGLSRNKFKVKVSNVKGRTGKLVEVAVFGEPGSYVGLSASDKPLYSMQSGNEIAYSKVISKMLDFENMKNRSNTFTWYSHQGDPDQLVYFPSSSFGIDVNRTFDFASLVVFTDANIHRRPDLCNATQGYGECLNGKCYRLEKRCDGQFDCDGGTDEAGCFVRNETDIELFRKYRFSRNQRHYDGVWLWKDFNIGTQGKFIFQLPVPEYPAHWMISAVSVSRTNGFGMLRNPIEYLAVLPFYINVEMPTTIHQGEQVGIRVTVFNYIMHPVEAVVSVAESSDYKFVHVEEGGIVNSYQPKTSHSEFQFFTYIQAQDANIIYLPIVPVRLGYINVTVSASSPIGKDKAVRTLHVIADGLPQYKHESVFLDLSSRAYVMQYLHVNVSETPEFKYDMLRRYVLGSNKACISVVGDVVGPMFPTMPVNATSLLKLPMNSAEQSLFGFAVTMYSLFYFRQISLRNKNEERQAFYHMNIAYQKIASFMKEDGSFGLFRSDWNNSDSSVWLTANVVRVLQEATFAEWDQFIFIDPEILDRAVTWILDHQSERGYFYEVTWHPDRKFNATPNSNITLTAHVLIALEYVSSSDGNLQSRITIAKRNAVNFLDSYMGIVRRYNDPYQVAIVAYALTTTSSERSNEAFQLLSDIAWRAGGYVYWGKEEVPLPPEKLENQKPFRLPRLPYKYDSSNIEATAYGLLVFLRENRPEKSDIGAWLNSQRLTDGGWASTSDTMWALKALIESTKSDFSRKYSGLNVTIEASAIPGHHETLFLDRTQLARLQSLEIPNAWGTIKTQTRGSGYGVLQMTIQYNVDHEKFQIQPPVKAFEVEAVAKYLGRNQSLIHYTSCQRWTYTEESPWSGLTVLDVSIPTGYYVQQQNLDSYVLTGNVQNLKYARYLEKKVIFYFDHLTDNETCVDFTIERWHPVANMTRYLAVRVYDYYAPERFNEMLFDATPTYLLSICEVCGSSQCPYCSIYSGSYLVQPNIIIILTTACFTIFLFNFRSLTDFWQQ